MRRFLDTLEKTDIFKILNKIEKSYYEENTILKAKTIESEKSDETQKRQSEIDAEEAALTMGQATTTPEYQEEREQMLESQKK